MVESVFYFLKKKKHMLHTFVNLVLHYEENSKLYFVMDIGL